MATAEQVVDTRSQRRRSKRQRKKQRKREAAAAAAAPAVEATVRSDTRTQQDEGDVVVLQQGDVERRSTLSAAAPEFRPPVAVSVVAGGGGGGRQASGNASSSNGSNNSNNNNSNNGGSGGGGNGGGDSRKRGKRYGGAGGGIPSSHELQQILDIVYHEPKAVQQPGRGRRRGGGGGGSHGSSSRRRRHSSESQYDYEYYAEPYRKEAFVQANYRFVLTPGKHVAASLLEADRPVDWSSVQMVFKPTDTPECCPICLEPPVAARITQCGHVFCFACILHYLTSEVSSGAAADVPKFFSSCRRCPLCQEMVDLDSLKSLEFEVQSSVSAGSRLEVVLLRRPKTLVLAVPVEEAQSTLAQTLWKGGSIGLAEANLPAVRFGRIVVATDLEAKWKRERAQLQAAIDEALVQLETAVAERRAAAKERANTALRLALGASAPSQQQQQQQQQQQAAPQSGNGMSWSGVARRGISSAPVAPSPAGSWSRRVSGGSMSPTTSPPMAPQRSDSDSSMGALDLNSSAQEEAIQLEMVYLRMALDGVEAKLAAAAAATTPTAEEEEVPEDAVSVPSADDLDAWYFLYQAADGSQVFLHSLNYRCLKHEFGDAEHFPPRLEGKILQIERLVMDEINRKRYRFLGHLPLRATFSIVELDLSSFLSPATLNRFASELAERDRARKQVLAAQKKRERRARQKQKQQEAKQQREREARQRERQELHEFLHESPAPLGDQEHFPSISPHASPQSSPVLTRAHTDPSGSVSVWSTVVQHGFASSDLWEPLPGSSSATSPPDAPLPPPMNAQDWVPLSANATPSRSSGSRKGKRRNKGRKVLFSSGYRG